MPRGTREQADREYEEGLVFVGMPFDERFRDVFSAIRDECRRLKLNARRVDQGIGSVHVPLGIRELIEDAEFCIFDMSEGRGNIQNEIGIATGAGIPDEDVLLIAEEGTKLLFNTASRRVKFYRSTEHLRKILRTQLSGMMEAHDFEDDEEGDDDDEDRSPIQRKKENPRPDVRPSIAVSGGNNVVAGGNLVIQGGRRSFRAPILPGTVAESALRKNYLDRLIDRYNEFSKWGHSVQGTRFSFGRIGVDYKREIGSTVNNTPLERFDAAVVYLQKRISNTRLGRQNKAKGQRLFRTFDEYCQSPDSGV